MNLELLEAARKNMTMCNACPVCNGAACKGRMPGPGGRGQNESFIRSYQKLQEIKIHMDTTYAPMEPDTGCRLFGRAFAYPVFAAPIGMVSANFGHFYDDGGYDEVLLEGCAAAGIVGFTGDGPQEDAFLQGLAQIKARGGEGIPTIKTWDLERMRARLDLVRESGAFAVASDIDCIGLVQGKSPFSTIGTEDWKELIAYAKLPVIIKGVMTPDGAKKALESGASGIVVSTHGGRVLADAPAPIEMLPAIAKAVGGRMTILVDGGFRTGGDVFKALALGADGVLIGRPFVVAAFGGGAEGVAAYAREVGEGLRQVMRLAGTATLTEIGRQHILAP